jgi:hypothetical protein
LSQRLKYRAAGRRAVLDGAGEAVPRATLDGLMTLKSMATR